MIRVALMGLFIVIFAVASAAWGQIRPQEQPTIPLQTQPSMAGAQPSESEAPSRPTQVREPQRFIYRTSSLRNTGHERYAAVYFNNLYREAMEEYQERYQDKYGEKPEIPKPPLEMSNPSRLQFAKPFSILLDEESQARLSNVPLNPGVTMPVPPQSAQVQQSQAHVSQTQQPMAQHKPQYFRPHIPFDPDLHYQVAQRRAMREQEALEAEKEAADQEQEVPELPLLERGRFMPLPEPPADSDEISPAAQQEAPQSRAPSEILHEQGMEAFQGRVYHNAMRTFQQLHEAAPDDLEAGFAYGLALFACNRFEQAAEILPKVIQEAERAGVELPAIGAFYANERDYRSHRAALERRLALNPGDETLEALLGLLPLQLEVE